MATRTRTDPDTTIGDLISRLKDDSRRLVRDEIRLAKIELAESVRMAGRGAIYLGIAFGMLGIALVGFAVFLAHGLAMLFGGVLWVGTMVAAGILLVAAGLLALGGARKLGDQPYTLDETREELRRTTDWISRERQRIGSNGDGAAAEAPSQGARDAALTIERR